MKKQKNIAVIPARGGSKRLPGKNGKLLGKYPLLAHSILYAQRFPEIIDTILVTTDNKELATIAESYNASVILRPQELAGDHEPVITALQHVLKNIPDTYHNLILLQPTNPLRLATLLPEAYEAYMNKGVRSLVSVSRFVEKYGAIKDGIYAPINYTMGQRSQDLEPMYKENGLIYITNCQAISEGVILTEDNYAFVTDTPFDGVDIDTPADFAIAEALLINFSNLL